MNKMLYEKLIQYILKNQNRFYRLAYSYTRNQEDALDAVQNAVCKALEAVESIRNTDAIKTWFYRILINECLRILQKRKKDALTADFEELDTVYYEKAYDQEYVEEKLAELTSFPVYVGLPEAGVVETREDLLKLGADKVFTEKLMKSVETADIDNFQPSKAGFSISDGGTANINFGVVNGVLAISGINY